MSESSNRRVAPRRMVVVPVQIDSAERKERLGVTRNVSFSGTLFLSNSKFQIGERLAVTFYLSDDARTARRAQGEVVRIDQLQAGLQWRYAMALQFDEPLPEADEVFMEMEERD